MNIDIQAKNIPLTKNLRQHIKRRLNFALNKKVESIDKIIVRLSDINGPKGGKDKHCLIKVVLPKMPDVVIRNVAENFYISIDRATKRVGQTVARHVSRSIKKKRNRKTNMKTSTVFSSESFGEMPA